MNQVKPSFDGVLTQGQAAEPNPGAWTGLPSPNFTYAIKRGATTVSTNPAYVWTSADVAAGADAMTVEVTATNDAGLTTAISDPVTIAAPLAISGSPPAGLVGTPYTFTPNRTGGHAPYAFALTGTLPGGLSFSTSTGAITGTPTSSGTASLSIKVTDGDGLEAPLGPFDLVVSVEDPGGPVSPIRYNFSFRQTAAGSNTWDGGGINLGTDVDPNDAETVTTVLVVGNDAYPQDTADFELVCGRVSGAGPTGSNASKTQASGEVLLAGNFNLTSKQGYTFETPGPGDYDVWFASGSITSATSEEVTLFGGLYSSLTSVLTAVPKVWKAATAYSTNNIVVSLTDLSVWKAAWAGTSGATAPSGAGPTFSDNGITWNRLAIDALEVFHGTNSAAGWVLDQNNTSVAPGSWASSAPRSFNVSGDYGAGFTFYADVTSRPRQFGFRKQAGALQDMTLRDIWLDDPGPSPEIYANQPDGALALRLTPLSGGNALSNYSLTGSLAGYLKLEVFDGFVWLVHNGNRLPDSLAGPQTLGVVQTDPASSPDPHTTWFTPTVISSAARPTSADYLGRIRTETYLKRKVVTDPLAGIWKGYVSGSFTTDVSVSSASALDAALDALTPTGSSWHRIRLANGTYEGQRASAFVKDFGTGGLLIEPDSGASPIINRSFASLMVHGIHFRGVNFGTDKSKNGGNFYVLRFNDPGSSGIGGGGKFNRVAITGCKVGIDLNGGNTATDLANHMSFVYMLHGESIYAADNEFDGLSVPFSVNGCYLQDYPGNSFSQCSGDWFGLGNAEDWTSTIGVFPTDDLFVRLYQGISPKEVDFSGYSSGSHLDAVQIRTFARNLTNWWPNAKPNNQSTTDDAYPYWVVGDKCYCYETAKIYEVTAVSKPEALTGSTPPSGTGTGIVDGDVTWAWVANYVHTGAIHLLVEDCTFNSASPVAGIAARQFFINSNGRHNAPTNITVINTVAASGSSYGIGQVDGDVYVEASTFVGPSDYKIGSPIYASYTRIVERGWLLAANNVNQLATTSSGDGIKRFVQNEVMVNFAGTSAPPSRPEDRLAGTFSRKDGTGRWTFPSVPLDGSLSREAFIEAVRDQVRAKAGVTAGID
ncbi:Ig domain-containing protein [Phenylobacterium sp. 58.2.17]|uniref:Ig domain-containing protein n=1 Tax=Phenylobacterium sp. 58.2.17 TaxID=2969306 RepID=UPI002265470B|nr:Ig domain-containing protein [Phenylobacterium sp. 58.2.17]MCX7585001.1 Ig domain-containing protein [Phenylobacterium sp. 58.2.17]